MLAPTAERGWSGPFRSNAQQQSPSGQMPRGPISIVSSTTPYVQL
jgi:hypothetical protein